MENAPAPRHAIATAIAATREDASFDSNKSKPGARNQESALPKAITAANTLANAVA